MKLNYFKKTKTGLKAFITGLFLLGAAVTNAQCTANFNYSVGLNGSVSFVSLSSGTTISSAYFWTFPGSSPALGGASATHTFNTNGYKTVCLTVISNSTSPTSCTATVCDSVLITNATSTVTPCNANFNYVLGPNGSVNFASTSTGTSVSTNYSWSFGGGATATGIAPTHTYPSNGTKWICLTITNSVTGCSDTHCDTLVISNVTSTTTPCNANFTYVLGSNGSVNFASTSTGTSVSTNYSWSFGGGATGTGINPTHTYTSNGLKLICLTITNSVTGCSDTQCDSLVITNVTSTTTPCNANFSYVLGSNGSVSFMSTSTGTSVSTNYSWNFGGSSTGTGIAPNHTYTSNGLKWVCLTITNSVTSCTSMYCDSLLITNATSSVTPCTPSVVFTLSKDSTMALTWNAYPFYPSNVTSATWNWGDGSSTTGLYPSHTYSAAGSYSICVTINVSCSSLTATYCYVASIFRTTESNDMILVNVKQALTTGIKKQTSTENLMSIYPNPNSGEFVLELNGASNEMKESLVTIYNLMGQQVFEKQVMANGKQTIDVSALNNGTYLVNVNSNGIVLHKKITIQK